MIAAAAGEAGVAFSPWALLVGVGLLIANGWFVAVEIALLAARRARVEELAALGDRRAQRALDALRELSITFSGAQLGITLASLGLGAVAEPAVTHLLEDWLEAAGLGEGTATVIGFSLGLGIVVFLHMVVGEMAPKNLALARAEQVAVGMARSFHWFVTLLRPLIIVLNGAGNLLVRAVGVEPVDEHNLVHTPAELRFVVAESRRQGTVMGAEARVLESALSLAAITAEDAMTPRVDLEAVAEDAGTDEVLVVAARTGFTRLPVYRESLDDIVGILHVKDLLVGRGAEGSLPIRPIAAVPHSRDLEHLLHDLLESGDHAAIVVDEYGGTAGLVTLEDVLEELVGDIADEFDIESGPRQRGRHWVVEGTLRRDELERLTGLVLDSGDSETVSGWMTEHLGRLVRRGDSVVTADGWRLHVLTLEGRRAGEVAITAPLGSETVDEAGP
ncbi:MAG: hemolysin family protein [Nitriliruptorales bacterium]|nr:hemolysin family protein [Nitriliruptorales bacterium]